MNSNLTRCLTTIENIGKLTKQKKTHKFNELFNKYKVSRL